VYVEQNHDIKRMAEEYKKMFRGFHLKKPYSSLNYKTPCEFESIYLEKLPNYLIA